ncbi:MAG: O-antigen ligase family protein [Gaiellaceae bacterium]
MIALVAYLPLLAAAGLLVWRRPVLALYAFAVGLAAHNAAMAALYAAGVRGAALTAIQAWKEVLLAVAAASVARTAWTARRLPFRPHAVDGLALAFAALVVVYALVPQDVLGGGADAEAVLLGARHALLPVAAYLIGRSLALGADELRRLGWTILGAAGAIAAIGLVEEYTVSVEWWSGSGVPEYFREELGFDYRGPGRMPENFAFNTDDGLFRRLISTFLSPLASAFMLAVALLVASAGGPLRRRAALPPAALVAVGLLFTLSRSTLLALAGGLVVLAYALRRTWPLVASAATIGAGVAFALTFTAFAPSTHFLPNELEEQARIARERGDVPESELSLSEPSIRSHLTNLRQGLETVARHPQGYGLGNAGAVARRTDTDIKAGESNYTELGVETGLAGLLLFAAWNLALLLGLLRAARAGDPAVRWAAAGLAAALATVLALGIQTDAFGVPWLAYCVWWLSGALVAPAPFPLTAAVSTRWSSATEKGLIR